MKVAVDKLHILNYPDPVLKKRTALVTEFGPSLVALAERMLVLMRAENGVGLAAPQVGVSLRLFVSNPTGEPGNDRIYVNPTIVERTGSEERDEGCLSLPNVTVRMRRATEVVMEAQNLEGNRVVLREKDLPARIWQHEVDHLDGTLIIDQMSAADEIANRRAIKQMQAAYKAKKKPK